MNDELYHYGVLGMKWGVRRTPSELGHKPKKAKKKSVGLFGKKKSKKTRTTKSSSSAVSPKKDMDPLSSLTNEEIRAKIERAELERRYRDLQPKKVSKGKAFTGYVMDKIVIPAATDASKTVVKEFLVKQGKAYLGLNSSNSNNNGNNSGSSNNRNNQNGNP